MEGIEAEREGKEFEEARAREKSTRAKVKGEGLCVAAGKG